MPYPASPIAPADSRRARPGRWWPSASAIPMLIVPATPPLIAAIWTGCPPETTRVEVLSIGRGARTPHPPGGPRPGPLRPRQGRAPRHDGHHAEEDADIDVLAEHDPGQQRSEHAFEIEEQGRRRGGR